MRIVGGRFKGRRLSTCEGPGYRPATMKVRESIFSMLMARGVDFERSRALDVFAGSGSLGIECLSRGASEAWFIEKSGKAAGVIRRNLRDLDVDKTQGKVVSKDALSVLSKTSDRPFDLTFIDPPYGKDLLAPALEKALANGWVAEEGLVLAEVETSVAATDIAAATKMDLLTDREYGQTRILLWRN